MRRDCIDFRLHDPTGTAHKTTLQGVIHQLDVALEDPQTQRSGLVFIYNMYGSKYSNFDYDLSQKMLTMLKGCYPARLKKVLIVTAPVSKFLLSPQSCFSRFFVPCSCSSQGQLSKTVEEFSALFVSFTLVPENTARWRSLNPEIIFSFLAVVQGTFQSAPPICQGETSWSRLHCLHTTAGEKTWHSIWFNFSPFLVQFLSLTFTYLMCDI